MMAEPAILTCTLEIIRINPDEIKLAFLVLNPGQQPVRIHYLTPFIQFELSALASGQRIPVIQPAYEVGAQPVRRDIAPAETIRIETPFKLVFDPQVSPSGGDNPTRWTLKHRPVAVDLTAELRLGGASVVPCQARWEQEPGAYVPDPHRKPE
jgi:hypothetical protein